MSYTVDVPMLDEAIASFNVLLFSSLLIISFFLRNQSSMFPFASSTLFIHLRRLGIH